MKKILKKLLAPLIREVIKEERNRVTPNLTIKHLIKEFSVVVPAQKGVNHSDKSLQYLVSDLKFEVVSALTEVLSKICNELQTSEKECPCTKQEELHH